MNLDQLTEELGQAYDAWKNGEKDKNELKDAFFVAVTDLNKQQTLAQVIEIVKAGTEDEARIRCEQLYPAWVLSDLFKLDDTTWQALLEEDPALRDYNYVNAADGRVYTRQIVIGAPLLDDALLKKQQPELWEEISETTLKEDHLRSLITQYYDHGDEFDYDGLDHICACMGFERQLKPLEDLTSEQLAEVQDYIYYGKPTVRFPAPRPAKPEELPEVASA